MDVGNLQRVETTPLGSVQLLIFEHGYYYVFSGANPQSKNPCKGCGSKNVADVGHYVEHCRDCDNWQAAF